MPRYNRFQLATLGLLEPEYPDIAARQAAKAYDILDRVAVHRPLLRDAVLIQLHEGDFDDVFKCLAREWEPGQTKSRPRSGTLDVRGWEEYERMANVGGDRRKAPRDRREPWFNMRGRRTIGERRARHSDQF
jgi:hypothetical protein